MGTRMFRMVAALATVVLVATGCGVDDGPQAVGDIETDVGVEDQVIRLGHLTPLTGAVAVIGEPLTRGHRVYFEYVNSELGGVGRDLPDDERFQVELVERDTQYTVENQVTQYNAIRDEVLIIAQSLGTPTTKAILPQINEDRILTGAATLSSEWLRERYIVPAGAPYPIQFINAADYIVNEQGVTPRAGIIYQDDDYGEEGLEGLRFAAEAFGFEIVDEATYEPTDTEFTAQITQMQRAGADHVFLTAVPGATGTILGTAAAAGYAPRWIGQSPTWIGAFMEQEQLVPYLEENLWVVTDASCEWGDTSPGCEGMGEMIQNLERYAPDQAPDYYFIFGYTQARIIHQILEKAIELGSLTREGVVEAFESLEDVDMGGLLNPISYGPSCEDKIPATGSTIFRVDPESPTGLSGEAQVDSDVIAQFPFC